MKWLVWEGEHCFGLSINSNHCVHAGATELDVDSAEGLSIAKIGEVYIQNRKSN